MLLASSPTAHTLSVSEAGQRLVPENATSWSLVRCRISQKPLVGPGARASSASRPPSAREAQTYQGLPKGWLRLGNTEEKSSVDKSWAPESGSSGSLCPLSIPRKVSALVYLSLSTFKSRALG